jgi:hypothetical protein
MTKIKTYKQQGFNLLHSNFPSSSQEKTQEGMVAVLEVNVIQVVNLLKDLLHLWLEEVFQEEAFLKKN